jgi:hypothetical protein
MSWWRISGMDVDGEGFEFLGSGALPFHGEDDGKHCNLIKRRVVEGLGSPSVSFPLM